MISEEESGYTECFFKSNELDMENLVEWIHRDDDGEWQVYFRLKGEKYFFLVLVNEDGTWKEGRQIPFANVTFCVSSTTMFPEEITALLGMRPSTSRRMGDPCKNLSGTYAFSDWSLQPDLPKPAWFEDKLKCLLHQLLPLAPILKANSKSFDYGISVAYYDWFVLTGAAIGWGFDKEDTQMLAELGADFDFSIYPSSDNRD
ncbi:MAG: hypothetical protein JW395_1910 [Nitrospira sp.]|nr:hypothetical protein [Nitrospira sp.]